MLSGISKPITPVGEENKQGKRRQGEILEVGDDLSQEGPIGSCSVAFPHTSLLHSAPRDLPHAFLSCLSPEPHHVSLADVIKLCLMKYE